MYLLDKIHQPNGEFEVHEASCPRAPPDAENRLHLGDFPHCRDALAVARKYFHNVNGCRHCSPECRS